MKISRISALFVLIFSLAISVSGCSKRPVDSQVQESSPAPTEGSIDLEALSTQADIETCLEVKEFDSNFNGNWQLPPFHKMQEDRHNAPHGEYSNVEYYLDEFVTSLENYVMKRPYPEDGTADLFTSLSGLLLACKDEGVLINGE